MLLSIIDHLGDGDLTKAILPGLVVNNNDPTGNLRIQVRISILHQGVSDADLPWCRTILSLGSSSGDIQIRLPNVGSIAAVYMPSEDDNTNIYYLGVYPVNGSIPAIVASIFPNCDVHVDKAGNVFYTNFETNTIYVIHVSGAFFSMSATEISAMSAGSIAVKAVGNINLLATGSVNITGSSVNLNPTSNAASSLALMPQPAPAVLPNVSNLVNY